MIIQELVSKKPEKLKEELRSKRLVEVLDPRQIKIPLADIARGIEKPVEEVYLPEPKPEDKRAEDAWKWPNLFLVVVAGEGGRFGSYRVLQSWMTAVIELLESCQSWQVLEELIWLVEEDLMSYPYPLAHRQSLREVLDRQRLRVSELKGDLAGYDRAWEWARGWVSVIKSCLDEASLNVALQLFKSQKEQFAEYAEVANWVLEIAEQYRMSLRVLV